MWIRVLVALSLCKQFIAFQTPLSPQAVISASADNSSVSTISDTESTINATLSLAYNGTTSIQDAAVINASIALTGHVTQSTDMTEGGKQPIPHSVDYANGTIVHVNEKDPARIISMVDPNIFMRYSSAWLTITGASIGDSVRLVPKTSPGCYGATAANPFYTTLPYVPGGEIDGNTRVPANMPETGVFKVCHLSKEKRAQMGNHDDQYTEQILVSVRFIDEGWSTEFPEDTKYVNLLEVFASAWGVN